jgi:hypothetical protein
MNPLLSSLFLSFAILALSSVAASNVPGLRARELANKGKVDICHYDEVLGKFKLIRISTAALGAFIGKHGPAGSLHKDMTVADANANSDLHSRDCVCDSGYTGDGLNCVDVFTPAPVTDAPVTPAPVTLAPVTFAPNPAPTAAPVTPAPIVPRLTCAMVNGMNWCYEKTPSPDQSCNAVCGGADKVLADNTAWLEAQNSLVKCEVMRVALFPGNSNSVSVGGFYYGCMEMYVGTGTLFCSNNGACPNNLRTGFNYFSGYFSICPCI